MKQLRIYKKEIISACIAIAFFVSGYYLGDHDHMDKGADEIRWFEENNDFSFVNPLLECDLGKEFIAQNKPRPYESDIQNYINSEKLKKTVQEVSVYYRDLNNGPWVGIKEDEVFFPASLLKVPIVMFMYKQAESNPGFLDTIVTAPEIVYENKVEQHFKPEMTIVAGNQYSYKELMRRALVYSDNDAALILQKVSEGQHLEEIFEDLHLDVDFSVSANEGYMNVKNYAMFFRLLYNTSYISQYNSEEMLRLLSESTFDQGIRRHIPEPIVVANKFGEIQLDSYGYTQLHDCGIVYYPSHPYILCVMTRGYNEDKLAEVISNVSRIVYEQIHSQVK